jgi:hypothetical protein
MFQAFFLVIRILINFRLIQKDKMEIINKQIFYGLFCVLFYLFLCDLFKKSSFKQSFQDFIFKATNNRTTHTFFEWFEHQTNQFAVILSLTVTKFFKDTTIVICHQF